MQCRFETQLNTLVTTSASMISPPSPKQEEREEPIDTEEYGVGMELECDAHFCWRVAGVRPGGPAAAAGITRGDLLRAVDWTLVRVSFAPHSHSMSRDRRPMPAKDHCDLCLQSCCVAHVCCDELMDANGVGQERV